MYSRIDENVALVSQLMTGGCVFDSDVPSSMFFIPERTRHLVSRLDVLVQMILACKIVEIIEYLTRSSVHCRPVSLRLEAPRVVMLLLVNFNLIMLF